jgi:ribosomal protein S18 acetylase RimI-like enzyme
MLVVRLLTAADAAAYAALRLEALEREPRAFGASIDEHQRATPETVAAKLEAGLPDSFIVGAFVDGRPRGMAGFARAQIAEARDRGHIWEVYVGADVRGRGIGRQLLQVVIDRVRATTDVEWVVLGVAAGQTAARRLYVSLGFIPFGVEPGAIHFEGGSADEEYMALRVTR